MHWGLWPLPYTIFLLHLSCTKALGLGEAPSKTHLFLGFQIHQATNTTKELDLFWCCLSQCCRTWHHQIIKLESVGPAVYAACQLKIRLRTTLFLKTLFYSFTILQILSAYVSATSFTNGIELQLIQEIWGVPMLLSPVSARSFMRVTLSYYTTYWWRYKYCYFSFKQVTIVITIFLNWTYPRGTLRATSLSELWLLKMRYCVKSWSLIDWPTIPSFLPV